MMRSARHRLQCRSGITTIELVIALTIAVTLAALGAIGVLPFLRKNRMVEAYNAVDRAAGEARTYARLRPANGSEFYGVRIDAKTVPNQVVVVQRLGGSERELSRYALNRNVQVYQGDQPMTSTLSWFCQPRTGYPVQTPNGPITAIAAVPMGNPGHLSLRSLDGRHRIAVAVYEVGLVAGEEF